MSDEIKNDRKIVLSAVKYNSMALEYANEELRKNKEFLYEIKEILGGNFERFSEEYELLKKYEREDELNKHLEKKEININKIKKKI